MSKLRAPLREVRFAVRTLTRSPWFTTVVVLTLALGVGASTAVFSVVNAVLLRPLPYPDPQRLVRITGELRGLGATDTGVTAAELFDYQARPDLFAGAVGIVAISANVTGGDAPARVEMLLVSWNYFAVLGIAPQHGRVLGAEDEVPGNANVAVVSDAFWRRHMNADPLAIGRTIVIDTDAVQVVGVMPATFRHPGRALQNDVEVWSPSGFRGATTPSGRARRRLDGCLARLQPGVTVEQAQDRLLDYGLTISKQFPSDYPAQNGWRPRIESLQENVVGGVSAGMLMLLGSVSLLLLIACVNIAHLVLARSSARRREVAIRQALGASSAQVIRQLMAESAVLATAGGVFGLLIASWVLSGLLALAPARIPRLESASIDVPAILVAAGISFAATILFGLVSAWHLTRVDASSGMKDQSAGGIHGRRGRDVLVAAEVAMATVLLIAAGLLIRSLIGLVNVPLGFETESLWTARISLPRPNDATRAAYFDPARRVAFSRETIARIGALPGVERVAMSTQIPMGGFNAPWLVEVEGLDVTNQSVRPVVHNFQVSPSYFETMRIPIARGRGFNDFDRAGAEPVAVVSQTAARKFWQDADPIGKRLRLGPDLPWMTVIGVAGDVLNRRLNEAPQNILYRSLEQSSDLSLALLVRTAGATPHLAESIAREVRAIDPALPIYSVRSMSEVIEYALAQRTFLVRLLVTCGAIATALALLGIYGVMAYSVSQRRREIGIRMAIGARQLDMRLMVLRRSLAIALVGAVIGGAASLALSGFVRSQLFGVEPFDPLTMGSVLLVMMVVATAAAYAPARRAANVDPVQALRSQ
jgi:predicted permease